MDEKVFRSVKRACYAGLDSVTLRAQAAIRIESAVNFDAFAFGTADPDTGLLNHQVAHHIPVSMARAYVERLYPLLSAGAVIDRARRGRTVVRAGEESQEVLDEQRAHGFRGGTHVVMASRGRVWGKWCLLRRNTAAGAISREHALLRRLAPHLTRGLQNAALVENATSAPGTSGDDTTGVLMLDVRGTLIVRTPGIIPMLEDLADVGVADQDAIPLSIRSCVERARVAVARDEANAPMQARLHARGRSGRWYSIQTCVAEPDSRGNALSVVTVRTIAPRERTELIAALYGLSPREWEIVTAVSRGETSKEISVALGVSPHTVKEHLDRACEKLGVRGRHGLVARLFFDVYKPRLTAPRVSAGYLS